MENFHPPFYSIHLCLLSSAPQYKFRSDRPANRKFFQAIAKFISIFRFISVFIVALHSSLFFAQIFGQSMHLRCSCGSCDHDHLSHGELKVTNFHTCAHRSCSVVFVVNHSGVQLVTQPKISGAHLPCFPYWLSVGKF